MMNFHKKKKNLVFIPESIYFEKYTGEIYGTYFENTGVFNIFSEDMTKSYNHAIIKIGYISAINEKTEKSDFLSGQWVDDSTIKFYYKDKKFSVEKYNIVQNIFSRNTGILESSIMKDKCAFILGCGSVGSLVALELARAGVGKFVLIDNDIVEYHNLCRHQCSIMDVGQFKVNSLEKRIKEINPLAEVFCFQTIVENVKREIFDHYCEHNKTILVGCADNREADVYANSIAITYGVPFVSIGFWERAFAGEIFYYLPNSNMPCYECALGNGNELSQRQTTNRRIYTMNEDLTKVNFEPGISIDINYITTIGIKLVLDILNIGNDSFTPRLLGYLKQYTLICNTNNPKIGGELAEIFSYPLQVTTSLQVNYGEKCPPCIYENK